MPESRTSYMPERGIPHHEPVPQLRQRQTKWVKGCLTTEGTVFSVTDEESPVYERVTVRFATTNRRKVEREDEEMTTIGMSNPTHSNSKIRSSGSLHMRS